MASQANIQQFVPYDVVSGQCKRKAYFATFAERKTGYYTTWLLGKKTESIEKAAIKAL